MTISVVIPAYNSVQFISKAIESAYAQSRSVDEIICIDDASTDNTADLVSRYFANVVLLRNKENQGPSVCRNQGIAKAKGTAIAFLDADDYWTENKTLQQSALLDSDPELDVTGGYTAFFETAGSEKNEESVLAGEPHFNTYLSSLLIRKTLFGKIGTFDPELRLSEDQDWFLRAREYGAGIKITRDVVLMKRIHPLNTTNGLNFQNSGMITALRNSLDRRRKAGVLHDLKPIKP